MLVREEPFDPVGALTSSSGSGPVSGSAGGMGGSGFGSIPAIAIVEKPVNWLVPDLIPVGMVSALIGDEGLGKGLFVCHLIAEVTTGENPQDVLLLSGEDDSSVMLRPRLRAAGADLTRVHFFNRHGLPGMPSLPEELDALADLVRSIGAKFLPIDPWLSVVSPKIRVRDTQEARQLLDQFALWTKELQISTLLVGHTNRSESTASRNRYGGSIAIRQAARISLMAVPDPAGPEGVIIGVDKTNISYVGNATRYRKSSTDGGWRISVHPDQYGMTIHEHVAEVERQDRRGDRRRTEHRETVKALVQEKGGVSRQEVIDLYIKSGSTESAADKALARWSDGPDAILDGLGLGRYGPAGQDTTPRTPRTSPTRDEEVEPW